MLRSRRDVIDTCGNRLTRCWWCEQGYSWLGMDFTYQLENETSGPPKHNVNIVLESTHEQRSQPRWMSR